MGYALFPIPQDYVRHLINEPIPGSYRFVLVESSISGVSRYLLVHAQEDIVDRISGLEEQLPPAVRPAISAYIAGRRSPQKLLNMLSEGRRIVSNTVLDPVLRKLSLPRHTPAYEFIAKRLLSDVPDPDDVLRFMAAAEDRKAIDPEGYEAIKPSLDRVNFTYLQGFLAAFSSRNPSELKKILSSHVRPKAIESAKITEIKNVLGKGSSIVKRILTHASGHIWKWDAKLLEYTRGSIPAAFLVFVRDHLNVSYVYYVMDSLGKDGYDVREVLVAYDSSSWDIAKRVSETLEYLGHVRSKTVLIPQTPGGLVREFLAYLIDRYERRGMKLFIDGRGGSPATFLAVLRNFRDRLVLPDKRNLFSENRFSENGFSRS